MREVSHGFSPVSDRKSESPRAERQVPQKNCECDPVSRVRGQLRHMQQQHEGEDHQAEEGRSQCRTFVHNNAESRRDQGRAYEIRPEQMARNPGRNHGRDDLRNHEVVASKYGHRYSEKHRTKGYSFFDTYRGRFATPEQYGQPESQNGDAGDVGPEDWLQN